MSFHLEKSNHILDINCNFPYIVVRIGHNTSEFKFVKDNDLSDDNHLSVHLMSNRDESLPLDGKISTVYLLLQDYDYPNTVSILTDGNEFVVESCSQTRYTQNDNALSYLNGESFCSYNGKK